MGIVKLDSVRGGRRVMTTGDLLSPGDLAPADLATILALADDFAADPHGAG